MLQRRQIAHSKKMVSIPDNTGMCKYLTWKVLLNQWWLGRSEGNKKPAGAG